MKIQINDIKKELTSSSCSKKGTIVKWSLPSLGVIVEGEIKDARWNFKVYHRDTGIPVTLLQKANPFSSYDFNKYMESAYKSSLESSQFEKKPETPALPEHDAPTKEQESARRVKESGRRQRSLSSNPLNE